MNETSNTITCIILNYNDSFTVIKLLNVLLNYNSINNIIIVDNKSTDNSYFILNDYIYKKNKSNKKNIILLKSKINGGYGYGNNIGIKYAYYKLKSKYLLVLNPDVFFEEKVIIALKQILNSADNIAIAAPTPLTPLLKPQKIRAYKLTNFYIDLLGLSTIFNKIFGFKGTYPNSYYINEYSVVDVVQGSMFMAKSDILINYALFDESFFLYCEEQIIGIKLRNNCFKSILLNNHFYIHYHSISIDKSYNTLLKKQKIFLNSKYKYYKKYLKINKFKRMIFFIFSLYIYIEIFIISFFYKRKF